MISIVIPAYNEENAITGTIDSLRNFLENIYGRSAIEIVVVDDGSSDSTSKKAIESGAVVIRHPQNVGYGRSLKTGIRAATNEIIVIIDADLTYPADAIPGLIDELNKGFDMVVGARTGHHYSGSIFKGPLRLLLKGLVEFVAGRKVPDANSGLRVFRKSTCQEYLDHLCDTFSFTTSQTLAFMLTGRFVSYVPISYYQRVGHTKVKLLKDSMRTLQYIAQTAMYYNPMKIFVLFSLVCIGFSVCGFVICALTQIHAGYFLGIGGLLLSVLMFGLGLMADLMRQILVTSKQSSAAIQDIDLRQSKFTDFRPAATMQGAAAPESIEQNNTKLLAAGSPSKASASTVVLEIR